MADFDPFNVDDDPEAPAPAEETPRKRGRPRKADALTAPASPREGTKHIGGNFPVPVSTELQRICIEFEERTGKKISIQCLLARGINHVLRQAGRQPIAKEDS